MAGASGARATRELAAAVGCDPLDLLVCNPGRPWAWDEHANMLGFASLDVGDVVQLPDGREAEIFRMAGLTATSLQTASVKLPTGTVSGQDVLNGLPPDLSAKVQSYATDQTKIQGASSAIDIAENGYNPATDGAKLVHIAAAAASFIPGVGLIIAGVIEAMWAVGNAAAGPLNKVFGNLPPGCYHTGPPVTFAQGVQGLAWTPGSFSAIAMPYLCQAWADAMNCDARSLWAVSYETMLPALAALWDSIAEGDEQDYFVPWLNVGAPSIEEPADLLPAPAPGSIDPHFGGAGILQKKNEDFQAMRVDTWGPLHYPDQAPFAFVPLHYVPQAMPYKINGKDTGTTIPIAEPLLEGVTWSRIRAKSGPIARHVSFQLHLGPPKTTTAAPSSGISTGAKVGIGVGVAAAAGVGLWAWLGRPLTVEALKLAMGHVSRRFE